MRTPTPAPAPELVPTAFIPDSLDIPHKGCDAAPGAPDSASPDEPAAECKTPPKPWLPEGGWGWVIVCGVAVTNMTNLALFSVYGLLFGGTLESWGLKTTGVAVISSSMNAVQSFSGLFAGPLLKFLGPRTVALSGGLLVTVGMLLSAVATQPAHIFVTWSFLYGLLLPSTFLMVTSYFSKRRAQAVGISLAGTGLGQICMPHLVRFLLKQYDFDGAVLILGALTLHSLPGCLLYRRPAPPRVLNNYEPDETQPLKKNTKILQRGRVQEVPNKPRASLWSRLAGVVRSLDLNLLWNLRFLNLSVGTGFVFTAQTSFSMIFPFFLLETVGLSVSRTATCMSVQSGADVLARLVLPFCIDRLHCSARNVMLVGSLVAAASRSTMAVLTGFPELVAMSAVTGFFRGATVLNQNLVVSEHVSAAKLPAALGMAMAVKGVCVLALGSLLGVVRDVTDSYPAFIHCLTGIVFFTGVIWLLEKAVCGSGQQR